MTAGEGIVLAAGEGRSVSHRPGHQAVFKAVGEDTGGAYTLCEYTAAPSAGPPPHVHHNDDEAFYLLEGELTVRVGERQATVTAGSFVFLPRGILHTFTNSGSTPARFLVIASPAGFDKYLDDMAAASAAGSGPPDPATAAAIAGKHGMEFVTPAP